MAEKSVTEDLAEDIIEMRFQDEMEKYNEAILNGADDDSSPEPPPQEYDIEKAKEKDHELKMTNQEIQSDLTDKEKQRVLKAVSKFKNENLSGENLQKAFNEIFQGQISPIVIAVKFDESIVRNKVLHLFNTVKNCRHLCSPIVASCKMEELQNKTFKWTENSIEVEGTIKECLKNQRPFVFYRLGLYSGISLDITEAANVVCREICWPHYFLIVGVDIGLETELQQDIQIVAAVAGLNDNSLTKLHDSFVGRGSEIEEYNNYGRCYGENAVYTLLITPSATFLRKTLENAILCCNGTTLTIIYSGHGEKDGSWAISGDDKFSGSDLRAVLQGVKPQHYPRIDILINSCYGFAFADEIDCLEVLADGLCEYLPNILRKQNVMPPNIEDKDIAIWARNYVSNEENYASQFNNWCIVNECITKGVYKIVKTAGTRIGTICIDQYNVSVVPFSAGHLNACGILPTLYGIKNNTASPTDWSCVRPLKPLPSKTPVENSCPQNPHIIVFPAANGDSTLFRWHNFNMLVDGGLKTSPPCFWNTVSCLPKDQKLDVVIVTHYDQDHIAGVLSLFNRKNLDIDIENLYTTIPPPLPQPRSAKQGSLLCQNAERHGVTTRDLVTGPTTAIVDKQFNSGSHHLRVFMLTPSEKNLRTAKNLMPNRGQLTVPNLASASLLIECKIRQSASQEDNALLEDTTPRENNAPQEDNALLENNIHALQEDNALLEDNTSRENNAPQEGNSLPEDDAPQDRYIYKYALLTGDAPSADILAGLNQVRDKDPTVNEHLYLHNRYNFVYIDIPHHGSKNNNPQHFLQNIATEVCVVSTDSKMYGHPDDETLLVLSKCMEGASTVKQLLFTYQENRPNTDKSGDWMKWFANFRKRCHFASNANYKSEEHEIKCWLVDLATHKFKEYNCSSVLM